MGNPMPAEGTIMNSLDNSSSLAIEAGGGVGGCPGGLSEPDQMNKSSLDKPIIGDSVTAMTNQKNKVLMRVINGVVLSVTIMVTLFMRSSGSSVMYNHVRRGFYCDDPSIRYPVRSETVSTKVLISASFIGGLTLFCIIEYCVIKCNTYLPMHNVHLCRGKSLQIPAWIIPAAKTMLVCFVASMANSILTDIGKNVIGRPRPNFLASCQPNVTFGPGQTCDELITQFQCLNSNLEASELEDQLKSFPSAHASFAAFMAFYLVLYLHERFKVFSHAGQRSPLRPFLQLCILAIYWWSALTRVSDYVHHPIDVLAGLLLGTCVALWSWTHLIELLKDIDQTHKTLKFSIT